MLTGDSNGQNNIYDYCYGLNVCVPPEVTCWNPNTQYDSVRGGNFGRWVGLEGGMLMMVLVLLWKRPHRAP